MIFVISGYSKCGKDYLFNKFYKGELDNYKIYHKNDYISISFDKLKHNCHRISFADKLKEHVANILEITTEKLEEIKDKNMTLNDKFRYSFYQYNNLSEDPIYRDVLIDTANKYRNEDINYWVKKVIPEINKMINLGINIVITDWRFINEIEYLKEYYKNTIPIITIRTHRSGIKIMNIESERSLDNYYPDYLFLDKNKCFYLDMPWCNNSYIDCVNTNNCNNRN